MISFRHVSHALGNKQLFNALSFNIFPNQKIGLVGKNGCGKSTLLKLLLGHLACDSGSIDISSQLDIAHLAQHLPETEQSAVDFVLSGDTKYHAIQQDLLNAEVQGLDDKVVECHNELALIQGYSKPAKAQMILAGLGFKPSTFNSPVSDFSGGWQMRLNLAKCLMQPADLYLLDEPTNHLDLEAIIWLEKWIKEIDASCIIISHDRDFLDGIVQFIFHIEQQQLTTYTGHYSQFEIQRAQKIMLQNKAHVKQQKKIDHMMSYVNRFRAKASKSKQAQSRLKAINKIEHISAYDDEANFHFEFSQTNVRANPLLKCEALDIGYEQHNPVIKNIEFSINPGDRIGLLAPNGEGKSTFIKTLCGTLNPLEGNIYKHPGLSVAYYAQHQLEDIDKSCSPFEIIKALDTHASDLKVRQFLGSFNFSNEMAIHPCRHFSGGELARLALARLVWQNPNLLLLDEPTNHLDIDMRNALGMALIQYTGALILISHDRHLLNMTIDNFYVIDNARLKAFDGTIEDYYQGIEDNQGNSRHIGREAPKSPSEQHQQKKSLQNRAKKLEQLIDDKELKLSALDKILAESDMYLEHNARKLESSLNERAMISEQLKKHESEWEVVLNDLEKL